MLRSMQLCIKCPQDMKSTGKVKIARRSLGETVDEII